MKLDMKIAENLSLEKKGWYLDYVLHKEPPPLSHLAIRWKTSRASVWRFLREIKAIEEPKEQEDTIRYDGLLVWFNNKIRGTLIPQIRHIDSDRRRLVRARVSEYGKEMIDVVMQKVLQSDFLTGKEGGFCATFDWIFKKNNFKKIIEGNYDNRIGKNKQSSADKNSRRQSLIGEARRVLAEVHSPIYGTGGDIQ